MCLRTTATVSRKIDLNLPDLVEAVLSVKSLTAPTLIRGEEAQCAVLICLVQWPLYQLARKSLLSMLREGREVLESWRRHVSWGPGEVQLTC